MLVVMKCDRGASMTSWWLTDQFQKMPRRIIKLSCTCILMIVASIFKAFCHWEPSPCCQAVYWAGGAATSCNWMSIRPKQFWLIHSPSLSIFTRTDYIWQIVTFSWTLRFEAWVYTWQWARSWCLMFISYSVFTFPPAACVNLYLNIVTADSPVSPLVTSGRNAVMIPFHCLNKNNLHSSSISFIKSRGQWLILKCLLDEQWQLHSKEVPKWWENPYISKNLKSLRFTV